MSYFKYLLSGLSAFCLSGAADAMAFPSLDSLVGREMSGQSASGPCSVTIKDHASDQPNYGHIGLYVLIRQNGQSYMAFNLNDELRAKFARQTNPILIQRDRESMANGDLEFSFALDGQNQRITQFTGFMTGWHGIRIDFNCRF